MERTISRYKSLTTNESDALRLALNGLGINKAEYASRCGMHLSSLNQILTGKRTMSPKTAVRLINMLGEKPSLNFLREYMIGRRQPVLETDRYWLEIFRRNFKSLEDCYSRSPSETKGTIIGDLEKLVEKYRPK